MKRTLAIASSVGEKIILMIRVDGREGLSEVSEVMYPKP